MPQKAFRRKFADNLKRARLRRGLTQRRLAEQAGIAEKYLSRLELGMATPSLLVALRLAQALGVGLDALADVTARPESAELSALVRLLRGRSPAELARLRRALEELLR